VIRRLALLPFACALVLSAHAQDATDGPVKMTPEFCFTFPVTQMNKHDISVKYPVMINPVTVLKPGMVLRVIYVPPIQGDTVNLLGAHKGDLEQSYTRVTANTDAHAASLPPEMAHEIEKQRRRVWEVPGNFVLAIAQLPTDVMHLIYSPTGKSERTEDLVDTSFSFFDGMFVGSPDGGTQVLAVEKGSYADQAGVKAGDDIVAVGRAPVGGDLNAFAAAFAAVKKVAKENEQTSFPMTLRSGGATRTVAMPLTPSIKNFLNGGF
jgi:hypothetical protein